MADVNKKILLADDEQDVLMLVSFHLQRAGYNVVLAENGRDALVKAEQEKPVLAILDRLMPEMDGVEVCRHLREVNPGMYIIMLTAMAADEQRIGGLEAGADDYISKPFNAKELMLKVKAMLRRAEAASLSQPVSSNTNTLAEGILTMDVERRQVWKKGTEIDLTKLEFDLFKFLYEHPNLVFSRDRLLEQVWKYDYFGDERVVDVHMARLRKKLEEDPARPRFIQTIRGVGYKYTPNL